MSPLATKQRQNHDTEAKAGRKKYVNK